MSLFGVGAKEARARIERARSQVPEAFGAKDVLSKRDVKFAALHLHPDKCSLKHDAETCTALFKDGTMYVQAGGGVVADSDPDAEYDETLHKSNALRRAAEEAWRFS